MLDREKEVYITLDERGYLRAFGDTPGIESEPEPMLLPSELNDDNWTSFRYEEGELVLDEEEFFERQNEETKSAAEEKRQKLFRIADVRLLPGFPLKEGERIKWILFRQEVVDLVNQEGWPLAIEWPEYPDSSVEDELKLY